MMNKWNTDLRRILRIRKTYYFMIRGNPLDPRNPRSILLQEDTDD